MKTNNPVYFYAVIKRAHTFRGKAASTEEVTRAIKLATSFPYTAPDKLPVFKQKWDELFDKKFNNLGITLLQVDQKTRFYCFANALRNYPHSDAIKLMCVQRIAYLDQENQDLNIDTFYRLPCARL